MTHDNKLWLLRNVYRLLHTHKHNIHTQRTFKSPGRGTCRWHTEMPWWQHDARASSRVRLSVCLHGPRQSVPVLTYVSWRCSELGMMDCLVTHPQLLPPPPPPRLSTTGAVHSVCASLTSRVCVSLVNTAILPPTTRRLYNLQRSDISRNFRNLKMSFGLFFSFLWTRENQNYKRINQETSPTNLKGKNFHL